MRRKLLAIALSTCSALASQGAWAGSEAGTNTWYGFSAAGSLSSGTENTLIGGYAGDAISSGGGNTLLGYGAGNSIDSTYGNTMIGHSAGTLNTGAYNVFIGQGAGFSSGGTSNRLYIDNCFSSVSVACDRPLILGRFDARTLALDGVFEVSNTTTGLARSQLHFSMAGTDVGGWLTSVGDNNFFMSSGARFEGGSGGWLQRSSDGNAVMAGSGATGYKVFTSTGTAVGAVATLLTRFHIDYSGNIGLNTFSIPGMAIATGTGAYLSAGGVWTNASSRALKEDIRELSGEEAARTLGGLRPVSFRYRATDDEAHVGFIAEDVPELVPTKDRKGVSSMDVVAVLTRVVQEQDRTLAGMREELTALAAEVRRLRGAP
jgi:hypothetical protein